MTDRSMWKRWMLLGAGWACWGVAMERTVLGQPLISVYPEAMRVAGRMQAEAMERAVVGVFLLLSVVWFLSPPLTALSASRSRVLRSVRWVGWLLVGIVFVVWFLVHKNGPVLAFFLLGISHLLACAAIVRWRGEVVESRGFEVLPMVTKSE